MSFLEEGQRGMKCGTWALLFSMSPDPPADQLNAVKCIFLLFTVLNCIVMTMVNNF